MKTSRSLQLLSTCAAVLLGAVNMAQAAIPANGNYTIVNRATGKVLDNWSATVNADPVRQYDNQVNRAQTFTLSNGSGYWKLKGLGGAGLYLDSFGHSGDGTTVCQYADSTSNNQRWIIEDLGTGYHKIKNVANGQYLDSLGSTTNGDAIVFWAGSGSYNQQWQFLPPSAIFYSERTYTGVKSQPFPVGTYNTAQMVAKGVANNSSDSLHISPGVIAVCYPDDNFGGNLVVFSQRDQVMSGIAGGMSSLKIQTTLPPGHVMAEAQAGLTEFWPSALFGTWIAMHRGDWVRLVSNGTAKYTCRYETEYWKSSGGINAPTIVVNSGTNVLVSTNGGSAMGTCTGTALPWEAYYSLNGKVTWTNVEGGCSVNFALRDGGW